LHGLVNYSTGINLLSNGTGNENYLYEIVTEIPFQTQSCTIVSVETFENTPLNIQQIACIDVLIEVSQQERTNISSGFH
jgi:hypothetical protein